MDLPDFTAELRIIIRGLHQVLWGRDYLSQDKPSTYPPRVYGSIDLVSSDATGHIIVWDVSSGQQIHVLQEGTKPVSDMNWVIQSDGNNHILAALYPSSYLVLWDTRSGSKLWKKNYNETIFSFDFDPFHPSKVACKCIRMAETLSTKINLRILFIVHCTDCILFVEDFTVSKVPTSNGRKFYVSSPRSSASGQRGSSGNLSANKGSVGNLAAAVQEERTGTKDKLRRLMKDLVIGEVKPKYAPEDCCKQKSGHG